MDFSIIPTSYVPGILIIIFRQSISAAGESGERYGLPNQDGQKTEKEYVFAKQR